VREEERVEGGLRASSQDLRSLGKVVANRSSPRAKHKRAG